MKLSCRAALTSDSRMLAEWNHRLIRDEGHRNAMTVPELEMRLQGWLQGEYHAVIYSASTIGDIGYALYRSETTLIYLRQFYIVADQRRKGFGRECFRMLREEIWPRTLRLVVEVLTANRSGIAFWKAMGYSDYCLTLEIMPNVKPA